MTGETRQAVISCTFATSSIVVFNVIPLNIKLLIREKNRACRKARITLSFHDRCETNRLVNEINYKLKVLRNDSWSNLLERIGDEVDIHPIWKLKPETKPTT